MDWFRHRDGRPRRQAPANLTPLQQQIYQAVFVDGRSHEECFQRLQLAEAPPVSTHDFAEALRATYRRVGRLAGNPGAVGNVVAPVAPAEEEMLDEDAAERIGRCLVMLDLRDRLAIQLFVVDELPAAEVARIVGWPNAKMVYNRVARGLADVRGRLKEAGLSREDLQG